MTAEERRIAVEQAIANQRLEGSGISPETRKVMDGYIAGKMTAEEAAEQVYVCYGVYVDPYLDPKTGILHNVVEGFTSGTD